VQQAAETVIALVIIYLAVRLLRQWRAPARARGARRTRTRLGAFAIGLVHGMGGSAGVGVLIVASVESTVLSIVSLGLLAAFTAVSMWLVSTGLGATLVSRPLRTSYHAVAPALATLSLTFGVWYGTAAWGLAPYPF
jgi:hypothetical protein